MSIHNALKKHEKKKFSAKSNAFVVKMLQRLFTG